MSQLYDCLDQSCQDLQYLSGLDEVIDHLRKKHRLNFIRRLYGLGDADDQGLVWYCEYCQSQKGHSHRSFESDKAMWDHLNDRHGYKLDKIRLG